jgi:hypothetical protein
MPHYTSMERIKPEDATLKKKKEEDKKVYQIPDEKISCDKGNHKERSLANQPNHLKFWKKQKTSNPQ